MNELRLYVRAITRFGAYIRAKDAGATAVAARVTSEARFPLTPEDREFEIVLRDRGPLFPWGSALAIVFTALYTLHIAESAIEETGERLSAAFLSGYAVAGIGWWSLIFGGTIGRFVVLDLYRRSRTIGFGLAMIFIGTIILNLGHGASASATTPYELRP